VGQDVGRRRQGRQPGQPHAGRHAEELHHDHAKGERAPYRQLLIARVPSVRRVQLVSPYILRILELETDDELKDACGPIARGPWPAYGLVFVNVRL
jgi:hypothetical protein